MRRSTFPIGLAVLALLSAGSALAQVPTRAERPAVKVGDASVFRDQDVITGEAKETRFHIVSIDPDKIVIELAGATSGTQTFTRDWNLMETKRGNVVAETVTPFRPTLQFPLQVGKRWDAEFDIVADRGRADRQAHWQWKAVVAAVEPVTVPGGAFQAFRIDAEGSFKTVQQGQIWTGTHKETVWYAPSVNRIVKREYEQTVPARHFVEHHVIELLSFAAAK